VLTCRGSRPPVTWLLGRAFVRAATKAPVSAGAPERARGITGSERPSSNPHGQRPTLARVIWAAQFRRISKRRGPKRAGIAVAHSILVIAYHMLRNGVDFNDLGVDYFDRMNTAKLTRYHLRRLAELGCDVSALAASA
jgi:hypothetical protein